MSQELLYGAGPAEVVRPAPAGTASPIVMDAHAERFTDPAEKAQKSIANALKY